jgi:predicted MPP superfamily phosphohydrolase
VPDGWSPTEGAIAALGVIAAAAALYAVFVAPRQLRVTTIDVPVPGLGPELDGYTVGVLSDLHQAAIPGLVHTRRATQLVQRVAPDLVALLGDFGVSFKHAYAASRRYYHREMRTMGPLIRALSAPDGVVAVLGNHDYYYNGPAVRAWLAELGVRVLVNEALVVRRGGSQLVVAGLDDVREGRPDPRAACDGVPPGTPLVVLSHNPDGVLKLAPSVRPALVLSGHTHGGQVVIPFYGAPLRLARVTTRKAASGWIPNPYAPLFVTTGVGSQIPLRFGSVPEVVIVRLRRPA